MKIALYTHHHYLPFWHDPKEPYGFYEEFVNEKSFEQNHEDYILSMLDALSSLNVTGIIAHVSIILEDDGTIRRSKRTRVQITTIPEMSGSDDMSIVDTQGKVRVQHIWGGDNGTYEPRELLESDMDVYDVNVWEDFFRRELRKEKASAIKKVGSAKKEADRFIRLDV